MDANLMHISYESGILEDPNCSPPDDIYQMTSNPESWPNKSDLIKIEFLYGIPVRVENVETGETFEDSLEIFNYLNEIG
jgi:argininosuccinate synthase